MRRRHDTDRGRIHGDINRRTSRRHKHRGGGTKDATVVVAPVKDTEARSGSGHLHRDACTYDRFLFRSLSFVDQQGVVLSCVPLYWSIVFCLCSVPPRWCAKYIGVVTSGATARRVTETELQ